MSILPPGAAEALPPEQALELITSSGRPFRLMDVRVVDDSGRDVAKGSGEVREGPKENQHCRICSKLLP